MQSERARDTSNSLGRSKKLAAVFYKTAAGNEPVRDWLMELDKGDRFIVGTDNRKLELGGRTTGRPTIGSLGDGMWEVRSTISRGKVEARVLVQVEAGVVVLLHAFIKSTRTTPKREIDRARRRWADMRR